MPCKVYAHLDLEGFTPFTLPIHVAKPEETQFGTLKQALLQQAAPAFPVDVQPQYGDYCFWNQEWCPIPDHTSVAVYAWEHNDFFLRPLPQSAGGNALRASREQRGELSYYYAHNRGKGSLITKPQILPTVTAPAAPERKPLQAVVPGKPQFNPKQSPFGTDITGYETISTYTWEDHDNEVKVLVPLDGVGKLPPESVRSRFGVREFELLIDGYQGKKLRFACYKTHGEMKPEQCRHVVRANRINLILPKAKDRDIWFDLFKKRAIGDDDAP